MGNTNPFEIVIHIIVLLSLALIAYALIWFFQTRVYNKKSQ